MVECSRLESGRAATLRGFESHPRRVSVEQFVIRPRPAVRAFAIAAVLALLGALVLAGDSLWGWGVVAVVVAVVLVVAAVALVGLAIAAAARQGVTVELDDDGFRVRPLSGTEHSGRWSEVSRVTAAPGRLTLHSGDEKRVHLIAPPGSSADLDALGQAIGRRLDANRGYRTFEG